MLLKRAKLGYDSDDALKIGQAILALVSEAKQEPKGSLVRQEKVARAQKLRKEAAVMKALQSEAGLKLLAANLREPVKDRLDYKAIGRQFAVLEQMNPGEPLIYDRDLYYSKNIANAAVKVGKKGTSLITELEGDRIELDPFNIVSRVKVPYDELYDRRFKAVERAKERLAESMGLREDILIFATMTTAAAAGGTTPTVLSGRVTKRGLAIGFSELRKNRVPVANILMEPDGMRDIMTFDRDDFTPAKMDEVLDTGFLGTLWGVPIHVTDQISSGTIYICGDPMLTCWMPIRKDIDVIVADDPDNLWLGFVGYTRRGLTWHNSRGINKITFDADAA